jgi:hypothetical protein
MLGERMVAFNGTLVLIAIAGPMMGWTPSDLFSASYVPAGLMWCRSQRNPEGVRHECYDRCGGFGKERVRSRCRRSELESY